jgi:hypothetical protein
VDGANELVRAWTLSCVHAVQDPSLRVECERGGLHRKHRAHARLDLIDGVAGAVWAPGGQPRVVFKFTVSDGTSVAIDLLADPEQLRQLDLAVLGD